MNAIFKNQLWLDLYRMKLSFRYLSYFLFFLLFLVTASITFVSANGGTIFFVAGVSRIGSGCQNITWRWSYSSVYPISWWFRIVGSLLKTERSISLIRKFCLFKIIEFITINLIKKFAEGKFQNLAFKFFFGTEKIYIQMYEANPLIS